LIVELADQVHSGQLHRQPFQHGNPALELGWLACDYQSACARNPANRSGRCGATYVGAQHSGLHCIQAWVLEPRRRAHPGCATAQRMGTCSGRDGVLKSRAAIVAGSGCTEQMCWGASV
jgi:hypothetical protein